MAEVYLPAGVEKKVMYPGKGDIPMFIAGTKVYIYFVPSFLSVLHNALE